MSTVDAPPPVWDPPSLPTEPAPAASRRRGSRVAVVAAVVALLALALGALVVATGALGGDGDDATVLAPVEAYSLAAAVDDAVAARAVYFDVTVSAADLGEVTVSGAVDNESGLMTVSTDLSAIAGLDDLAGAESMGAVELLYDGRTGVLYLGGLDGLGGFLPGSSSWVSADLEVLAERAGLSLDEMRGELFVDPTESARVLLDAEDVVEVGTETIDGVETVHYQATVDLAAALAAAAQADLPADLPADGLDELGVPDTVVYDVWVTADNQLRRARFDVDIAGAPVSVVFDMTTDAEPLEVELPADAFDITSLLDF